MNRRSYLLAAGGATGLLAGCVDALALRDGGIEERDPPDRPTDLTPESVEDYVAAFEEAHAHNEQAARGAGEVTIESVATHDHASGGSHYATARHAGTVSNEENGDRSVGELYSDPIPYLVTPDRTLRLELDRRIVDAGESEATTGDDGGSADDETASPPLGVRLLNVTAENRDVAVTVTRRADGESSRTDGESTDDGSERRSTDDGSERRSTGPTLVDAVEELPAESATELRSVGSVRGEYRVVARTEKNGVTGEGRIAVELPAVDRSVAVDVVIDDDGVSTRHLPPLRSI